MGAFPMAVFCEPRNEADILAEVGSARRVLVVGCALCANVGFCLADSRDLLPAYKLTFRGVEPVFTRRRAEQLSQALDGRGVETDTWVSSYPNGVCALSDRALSGLRNRAEGIEAVIVLACETGAEAMARTMQVEPTIGAMHAKGLLTMRTVRRFTRVFIDRDSVEIKSFAFR
jgi:hypothetical protein